MTTESIVTAEAALPNDIWDVLLTPEAAALIALLGVILAAVIGFVGILINNYFENKRKREQRQIALVRDAYFGATEYISSINHILLRTMSGEEIKPDESYTQALQNYYKLLLIASPTVVQSFMILFDSFNEMFLSVMKKLVLFKELCVTDDASGVISKEKTVAQFELIQEVMRCNITIFPLIRDCLFSMRKDMERTLSDEDIQKLSSIMDASTEKNKIELESFIEEMKKKVDEYE